jgi:hypothetical protein
MNKHEEKGRDINQHFHPGVAPFCVTSSHSGTFDGGSDGRIWAQLGVGNWYLRAGDKRY